MDAQTYQRSLASMRAGEEIEERYEKEIAAWCSEHDRDAMDRTPEMRRRWRLFIRALNANLDLEHAFYADFLGRLYRNGQLTEWPVHP